jgi:hypothetical protein
MKDTDKDKGQALPNAKRSKKAYSQPQLQVYGDLREITHTLGMTGAMDQVAAMKVDKTSA